MIRTGEQYKESIRGNREIYMNGERVKDVTNHPMFKPIVDIRARVYDMQHEVKTSSVMTVEQNGETHAVGNALPYTELDWWGKRRATDLIMEDDLFAISSDDGPAIGALPETDRACQWQPWQKRSGAHV